MRPLGAFRFIRTLINNGRIVMRAPPFTGSFTDPRPFLVRSGIHLRTSLPCENSREPGGWRKGGGWRKKLLENLELESPEIFEENLSPPFEMELNRNRSFSPPPPPPYRNIPCCSCGLSRKNFVEISMKFGRRNPLPDEMSFHEDKSPSP